MNGLRQVQEDSFSEALFVFPHTACLVVPLKLYKVIKLGTVGQKMSLNADPTSNGSQGHRYNAVCACQQ